MSDESLYPGWPLQRRNVNGVEIAYRTGGRGPALLLLHGYPQTHAIWHKVVPALAERFTIVVTDLRGYGDSGKPPTTPDHFPYSKRAMAADQEALMRALGHESFLLCGHDRGGRVAHRLALDYPHAVERLMLLDVSPTRTMFEQTGFDFAKQYYHWFFLIQPEPLPEKLISADPGFYLRKKTSSWGSAGGSFFDPRAFAEYERCFTPEMIHASCEDYRAAASIDLEHDRADESARIACPVRVLWGESGVVNRLFKPIDDWQAKCAQPVTGRTTPSGHYIPEEASSVLLDEMLAFFGGTD